MTKKQKQEIRFSKMIIIIVIVIVFIFTGSVLYIFNNKAAEPTAIIAAFFAFMTGEVLALAKIKTSELSVEEKKEKKEKEEIKNG